MSAALKAADAAQRQQEIGQHLIVLKTSRCALIVVLTVLKDSRYIYKNK